MCNFFHTVLKYESINVDKVGDFLSDVDLLESCTLTLLSLVAGPMTTRASGLNLNTAGETVPACDLLQRMSVISALIHDSDSLLPKEKRSTAAVRLFSSSPPLTCLMNLKDVLNENPLI